MSYNTWIPNPGKKKKRKPIINITKNVETYSIRDLIVDTDYRIGYDKIYFIINIENVGNQPLKNIYISNNLIHHIFMKEELDIEEEATTLFVYDITLDDFNRGYIHCSTMGFSVDEKIIQSNISEVTLDLPQIPKLSLYHYLSFEGEAVYHIKNCGNVTLTNITLYSRMYGDIYVNHELEPMEEIVLTGIADESIDNACVVGVFKDNDVYSNTV